MRILVVLSRVPYPLEKGDKLRAYHHIKYLHQKHEVILCCIADKNISKHQKQKLYEVCTHLYILKLSTLKIFFNLSKAIFSLKPFQVHYFYQSQIQYSIDSIIEKHNPKHIYCQLIRVTEYVNKYKHIKKTLDYMDCFSVGMYRRLKISNLFIKPLIWLEAKKLQHYETQMFLHYENKLIISEQDKLCIHHPQKNDIKVLPNGIDHSYFNSEKFTDIKKKYDIVFIGNMGYFPNIQAVQFLVKKIFPLLIKRYPDIQILISGANPSKTIQNIKSKNIHVSGWVEDIRVSYLESKIFVAPLFSGSGLQNKLLEAMSLKIPCITTSLANGALKAKPGVEIEIADTVEEFLLKIEYLLNNSTAYNSIASLGYTYVLNNFNWDKTGQVLDAIICE